MSSALKSPHIPTHFCSGFLDAAPLSLSTVLLQTSFRRLMLKQDGRRSEWEYPFAAAGVNITVLLIDLLDLRSGMPYLTNMLQFWTTVTVWRIVLS